MREPVPQRDELLADRGLHFLSVAADLYALAFVPRVQQVVALVERQVRSEMWSHQAPRSFAMRQYFVHIQALYTSTIYMYVIM